jgi:hypothetical protein
VDNHIDAHRTSLSIEDVFNTLKDSSAKHRVAIIDCCYSGLAIEASAAADTHLLAATNRVNRAHFVETERNTKFSSALLCVLGQGIPDGPEYIDLSTVYHRLFVTLRATGLPVPSQCAVNCSAELVLARNVAYGTGRSKSGLNARARFAQQISRSSQWSAHAVRLWEDIVTDASHEYSRLDNEALRYRHAYASCVGEAGDPAKAVELLRAVIADLAETMAEGAPALRNARASLEYWMAQ